MFRCPHTFGYLCALPTIHQRLDYCRHFAVYNRLTYHFKSVICNSGALVHDIVHNQRQQENLDRQGFCFRTTRTDIVPALSMPRPFSQANQNNEWH